MVFVNKMQCLLHDNDLKQVIGEFIRIIQCSKTLIDFIITNNNNISAKTERPKFQIMNQQT